MTAALPSQCQLPALPSIVELYARRVATETVEQRADRLNQLVSNDHGTQALQPIWQLDPHPAIVVSAALAWMMARRAAPTKPLAGPSELLWAIRKGHSENPAALLAAVALTGDHRIPELVMETWSEPVPAAVTAGLARAQTGILLSSAIDTYVRLLEQAAAEGEFQVVQHLERALVAMVRESSVREVFTLERNFGDARRGQPAVTVLERVAFPAFRTRFIARLHDLADTHCIPGALRATVQAWESRQPSH